MSRRVLSLTLLVLVTSLACGPDGESPPPPALAFAGATVIDGTGRPPIADAVLLVEGDRIVAVGPRSRIAVPSDAIHRDLSAKWVIPGMIDAHVHFWESGRPGAQPFVADLRAVFPWEDEVEWVRQRVPFTLSRYICSGVTSVIALGAIDWEYEVRELAQLRAEAPRVFLAGAWIDSRPNIEGLPTFAGRQLVHHPGTPEEAVALVRRLAEASADLTKIVVSPTPEHPYEEFKAILRALIDESHAQKLPVSVHAFEGEVAKDVLDAGADNLAHPVVDLPLDSAFLASARRANATVTSTLGVFAGHARLREGRFELEASERSCGDPETDAQWQQWMAIPAAQRAPLPPLYDYLTGMLRQGTENVRRLHASGVPIAIGSDGGNIGTMHGPGFHRELRLLAEAGLTPMDIIVAATRNGARVAGKEHELGTLEVGKLADFVVLDADPLVDVANLDRVSHIFVRGNWLERTDLQRE